MVSADLKEDGLTVRVNTVQRSLLAQAAKARHMGISQFILDAALQHAREIVLSETTVTVSPSEFSWLWEFSDQISAAVRLRAQMKKPVLWNA